MHALRRTALRSAIAASRTVSTPTRITPFAAKAAVECNLTKTLSAQGLRFFSQTVRNASTDSELEKSQRKAEEELDRQAAQDARQDVEESVAQTEADIQESMQEITPAAEPQRPQRTPDNDSRTVFIRNLVFEVTEEHLKKAFSKYGGVESTYVARDSRGLSKGFGFVTFESTADVQEACSNVNGSFWHGRRITCIPKENKRTWNSSAADRNSPSLPTSQLFIGNIPYETTDAELNRLFKGISNLRDVRVAVDRTTGWPRGFAHADFATVEAANEAKQKLQGAVLGGRPIRVDFATGYNRQHGRQRQDNSEEGSQQDNQ